MQPTAPMLDPWYLDNLVCPLDRQPLIFDGGRLVCFEGHGFPVIKGIPVLLPANIKHTHARAAADTVELAEAGEDVPVTAAPEPGSREVHPFVQAIIAHTNSNLYRASIGKLQEYPIPDIDLPPGDGRRLLDIGCNWGRWTLADNQFVVSTKASAGARVP